MRVLVTGATGNVGRGVVAALADRGVPFRAAASTDARARHAAGPGEAVGLDLRDAKTWDDALTGCTGVFLLRPPAVADTKATLVPFIDRARALGADHVVFLSVMGAGERPWVPHHAVERHLAMAGGRYTVLRPGFFAQNLGDAYRRDLLEDDRLYLPAGRGRVAWIDVRDVGEVAAEAFVRPEVHAGRHHTLTGPVAEDFVAAAAHLEAALGRPIRYHPASVPGYLRHLRRRGLPWGQAVVQTVLHVGLRRGDAERVDPTLAQILGRPGRTLADYVRDHADLWRQP